MKIAFGEVGRAKTRRTLTDLHWICPDGVTLVEALTGEVALQYRDEETVAVEGSLRGIVELACARCGDPASIELAEEFVYLVTTREEELVDLPEKECSDEECNTLFVNEPVIDIAGILQEQLFLAVPGKVLCGGDCRGLCQQCGGSLNRNECSCGAPQLDSPFAVLKKLRRE